MSVPAEHIFFEWSAGLRPTRPSMISVVSDILCNIVWYYRRSVNTAAYPHEHTLMIDASSVPIGTYPNDGGFRVGDEFVSSKRIGHVVVN